MKAKEYTLSNAEKYMGYELTYLDIPVRGNQEVKKDISSYDRINNTYNSSSKIDIWLSNFKGKAENRNSKPIPLNKIGLLSENFKRMKKYENSNS